MSCPTRFSSICHHNTTTTTTTTTNTSISTTTTNSSSRMKNNLWLLVSCDIRNYAVRLFLFFVLSLFYSLNTRLFPIILTAADHSGPLSVNSLLLTLKWILSNHHICSPIIFDVVFPVTLIPTPDCWLFWGLEHEQETKIKSTFLIQWKLGDVDS
jgi:hypothetical protein